MPFLPLVIINKTTWFSRLRLYFDLYASFIVFALCGTNNIFNGIVLSFCSNFFQSIVILFFSNFFRSSFWCVTNSIPSQLCWLIKGLIFDILSGLFPLFWWFSATVIAYWKQLLSFLFFRFIVAFLFSNHSVDFIYDFPLFKLILWRL